MYYKNKSNVDTFGTFDGGEYIQISKSLEDYRYTIAIENEINSYWFTEKILNCFAAMTVPIYIGAEKISDFFNPDGIIQVESPDQNNIDKIIAGCNEKDYESRISAIVDNYNRVFDYLCIEDYIYTKYSNHFA